MGKNKAIGKQIKMNTTPKPDSPFWQSPAITHQSKNYPARFNGGVPMRIRMLKAVVPDPWCGAIGQSDGARTILHWGEIYDAHTNSNGAVCGICANGFKLGVKPDEFEVVKMFLPAIKI